MTIASPLVYTQTHRPVFFILLVTILHAVGCGYSARTGCHAVVPSCRVFEQRPGFRNAPHNGP